MTTRRQSRQPPPIVELLQAVDQRIGAGRPDAPRPAANVAARPALLHAAKLLHPNGAVQQRPEAGWAEVGRLLRHDCCIQAALANPTSS
jgi:hypothetical protein